MISQDAQLADEVRRLCALAGQPLRLTGQAHEVGPVCRSASLVIVDSREAELVRDRMPSPDQDLVVVTDDVTRIATWEAAVRLRARRVFSLPADSSALLETLALATEPSGSPGPLIAVVGGRGGVGASTLSVALAWAVGQSQPVTLLDLDAAGGGLDIALGLERADGLRWPQLRGTSGVVTAAALREHLPSVGHVAVLSMSRGDADLDITPMPDRATVSTVLDAGRRGGGVVVADLPRWPSQVRDAVIAECTALVFVVPADVRGVAAATSGLPRLRALCDDLRLVIRTEARSRLRDRDVVAALALDHLATTRHESDVTAAIDRGELVRWLPRSQLGRTAKNAIGRLL